MSADCPAWPDRVRALPNTRAKFPNGRCPPQGPFVAYLSMSNTFGPSSEWKPPGTSDGVTETARRPDSELPLCPLLGLADVAAILGIPEETLQNWHHPRSGMARSGPRAVEVGNALFYKLGDVACYMHQNLKPGQ